MVREPVGKGLPVGKGTSQFLRHFPKHTNYTRCRRKTRPNQAFQKSPFKASLISDGQKMTQEVSQIASP